MEFQDIFLHSLGGPLAEWLDLKNEALVSYYMDQVPVQDSFRYRGRQLGLKMASLILDEKGELNRERLSELHKLLGEGLFINGPQRDGDALLYSHMSKCIQLLIQKKEIWSSIQKFSVPLCHKKAEEIVRNTLWPESFRTVQTVHVRKAAIAAWFTLLRQTTGSCFATAPGILIQQNAPMQFFKDLYDLLSMGQLKRLVGGKEYAVPLSLSSGMGDLQRIVPSLEGSPGIKIALDACGVAGDVKKGAPQSAEKVLRAVLLESLGLTEEDLKEEEQLSRIQMTPLLAKQSAVYYQRPSARAQKVAEWKKKVALAYTAFISLTECALLRSWEYTIASFCDLKTDFTRWNLYVGLGMHPDQKGGIGAFLYEWIDGHLQKCNQDIEKLDGEYQQEMGSLQAIEAMLQSAITESRRNQLKSEWMTHNLAVNSIFQMRNEAVERGEALVGFFSSLIEQYDAKLQEYFQELFDPAIVGEEKHLYEDSPAGFRLVYKHGRGDASQWTAIYSGEQYVSCLRDFFSVVENDLAFPKGIDKEFVSELATALIQFIQTPEFLASSMKRSSEMGRRSPWDYISGGTMQTLLQVYCNRDGPFTEEKIVPHSEEELLRSLAGVKKGKALLIHSPTHAFIFYPDLLPERWEQILEEKQKEVRKWKWDELMQEHLAHRVSERLPEEERALFLHLLRQKSVADSRVQFRSHLIASLGQHLRHREALVDSVLYEQTPLFPQSEAMERFSQCCRLIGVQANEKGERSLYGAFDIFQMVKRALLHKMKTPFSFTDWDRVIREKLGWNENPLIFGDTNWSSWSFGFVVNPATERLELWRLSRNSMQGFPMTDWNEWLSRKNSAPWIWLLKPEEYSIAFSLDLKNPFS